MNDGSRTVPRRLSPTVGRSGPSVKVIHQENKGTVVPSTPASLPLPALHVPRCRLRHLIGWTVAPRNAVLGLPARGREAGIHLDLLVTNYVYDKQGRPQGRASVTATSLPRGRATGWADLLRRCRDQA